MPIYSNSPRKQRPKSGNKSKNSMTSLVKSFITLAATAITTLSAHALVLGITEGVTYKASDAETEAKFAPIAKFKSSAPTAICVRR
jgi:hypothetical protein